MAISLLCTKDNGRGSVGIIMVAATDYKVAKTINKTERNHQGIYI